ncbi:MAG: hypothetical protein M3362_00700 [Acidobacteriota bacterium]|nr:hypothetical protein [Acidobacteriota bacterium]
MNRNDLAWGKGQAPSLDTEWEVALLNAFSKVGKVQHEPALGGRRKPDLHFVSEKDPCQYFAADITAISDKGFDGHNPFDAFQDELMRRVGERGLRQNAFNVKVDGNHQLLYRGGEKPKLSLPPISKFGEKIFNDRFNDFLDQIVRSPGQLREFRVFDVQDHIDLAVAYDPHQRYSHSMYLVYRKITHLTENVVYERLSEKRAQLLDSGFKGPLGIILCDGGFDAFHSNTDSTSYSPDKVIRHFLLQHEDIDFVLVCTIKQNETQPVFRCWSRDFFDDHAELLVCINQLIDVFPEVESDAVNAINHLRGSSPALGNSHFGGHEVGWGRSKMRITISARAVLELLAGKLSQQEFFERHGFIPSEFKIGPYINPFNSGLDKGLTFSQVGFEKSETEDDDWIVFELSGPDPAISPFVAPPAQERE